VKRLRSISIASPGKARQALVFMSASAAGTLIALSRLLVQHSLHANAPFILAWPGILLAAFMGGFWPAIVVTAVGVGVAQAVLAVNALAPLGPGGVMIFSLFGLVFAIAGGQRRRAIRRAAEDARRLSEMRSQLENVTRLNAMGEMAGVLAHELNQPLTAIASYVSTTRRMLANGGAPAADVADVLGKVSDQSRRAGEIIARLRGYVTRGEISASAEDLAVMFNEAAAVAMAGGQWSGLVLRADFDPRTAKVLADRIQIQQVMLNLIRNAAEAMDDSRRRELRIGCHPAGDGFVQAYVADTGPGVPDHVAERLFQPFVTGKPSGMGVGLSISRNIITAHGGTIWAERNLDGGATFSFTLPRAGPPPSLTHH
jgi:signal transduction histidine kinase